MKNLNFSIEPEVALNSIRSLFSDLFKKRNIAINNLDNNEERKIDNQIKSLVNIINYLPHEVSSRLITNDLIYLLKEL